MKEIRLTKHAIGYCDSRGFSEDEVKDTISTIEWETNEMGKLECRKNFDYNQLWNKKFYKIKQVRPIFVEDDD